MYVFFLQSNASDGAQSRLRKRGRDGRWSYTCTVRRPECKGQTIEVKTPLSRKDYEYLLNHTDEKRLPIFKTRRCFMYNNQSYQLDIYRWETAVKNHSKIDVNCLDLDLNDQTTGTSSHNGFIFKKIKIKWKYEKKSCERKWRAALSGQSADFCKIAKMALLNPCMKIEFFGGQMTSFGLVKNSSLWTLFIKCLRLRLNVYPGG